MELWGTTMRIFGILALALTLSGCANNQPGRGEVFASKAEIDAKDDSICRQYGAKAGEPVYIQCRVAQDQRRDAFRRD
jgi:outer membrane lipoprotein SlyB